MDTAFPPQSYARGALAVFVLLLASAAVLLLASGHAMLGLALVFAIAAPYGLYIAFTRPLVFPFGLYVLLVPFDNVLGAGSFGTITKLLGIISGGVLLMWMLRRGTGSGAWSVLLPLALLMLWMLASTFWSLDQSEALKSIPTYAGLILLYVALAFAPVTMRDVRIVLGCVIAGGVAAAAYGANVFYHDPALANASGQVRLVIQIGSSSIDPNHFANALLFPAAALAMWSLQTPRLSAKCAGAAGIGLMLTAILLSGSREALLALVLIALYFLWRSRYRLQVLAVTAVAIAVTQSVQTSMWERFASALSTGGSGRASIWAVAIEAAKHRLLEGYGVGNFETAYNTMYLAVAQPYPYGWSSPAHNIALHYTVELGIVGLALIAWFFWRQFRSLAAATATSPYYDYRVMLEASLLAIVLVSFSVDLFTYKYAWLVFAVVALFRNAVEAEDQSAQMRAQSEAMMAARPLRC